MQKVIGKVTATENKPTTCNTARFWLDENEVIRPFDIVRIKHISKKASNNSHSYAIVQDMQYLTDSASHLSNYVSSDFGNLSVTPLNERLGTTVAEAEVLYNDEEIEMPVRDGSPVEWADVEGIKDALGLRAFKNPIPAGYLSLSNGEEVPIEFESSYLIGPEGAHLNIAGISGLATKTSYAMFLLNSLQQRLGDKASMVIFNVKGNDLLAIDEPNEKLTKAQKEEWRKCGLKPEPFKNVTYLYPFANKPSFGYTSSHVEQEILKKQQSANKAFNYYYDVATGLKKLALLFSDIDDPNCTMESIVHQMPKFDVATWDSFKDEVNKQTKKGAQQGGNIQIGSWKKFDRLLESRINNEIFTEKSYLAKEQRQVLIHDAIKNLTPGSILVIDIEPLPDYLQCLVFGDVVDTIYKAKLGDEEDIGQNSLGTVVIFADELNKYAPKSSVDGKTLTTNLLEITERGRSLGVILFGAEQFRSGVHERILGNCSTNVFGRTSPVEISKCPDYRYFPDAYKAAIARLSQGQLLLQHAVFKTHLIKVRFPYPCYYQPKGDK